VQGFRFTGVLFYINVGLLLITLCFFAKGKQAEVPVDYFERLLTDFYVLKPKLIFAMG